MLVYILVVAWAWLIVEIEKSKIIDETLEWF